MQKHLFLLVVLFLPAIATARDKPENWVEIRSPHFAVISNSNEKQARGPPPWSRLRFISKPDEGFSIATWQ
ncbi:MAG TPA: hypothetical protein VMU26_22565 [Candidatus Polarisedimenticolia bacterium]|nr:hypothetical protein [Candidatus Polarisedimenticolia bacterium]